MMKKLMMLMTLLSLTACDYVKKAELNQERSDRGYRAAMEAYRAGRVDEAIKGFKEACIDNPANASARFQLACLLQDVSEDYFGAYCEYREYLMQRPSSDKAPLAKSRINDCERKMAIALAAKYGLNELKNCEEQIANLKEELRKNDKRTMKLTKDLEVAMQRTMALSQENERLKGFINAESYQSTTSDFADEVAAAKALQNSIHEASTVTAEEVARAKAMLDELEEGSPLLKQDQDAKQKRKAEPAKRIERPETYVVKDGDTLYQIALKFYGRSSAWKLIREANKTLISTDGRVRTGQKIVLPQE